MSIDLWGVEYQRTVGFSISVGTVWNNSCYEPHDEDSACYQSETPRIGKAACGCHCLLLNIQSSMVISDRGSIFWSMKFRRYTMTKWLLHDGICAGVFNEGYCSAASQNQSWEGWLTNGSGSCRVLSLLLMRMEKDWNALAAKFRKPWGVKDIDSKLHIVLGDLTTCTWYSRKFACQHRMIIGNIMTNAS